MGFRRYVVFTVISVYLVILAGAVVRTTGSGMGCPDWPKCFGQYIPPTDISQLPPNYETIYANHGVEAVFNPVKTWIEYANRLLGALSGIFVLAAFVLSLKYKDDIKIKYFTLSMLALIIFEAVLGKYVVSSNLKPIMISIHMWGSLLIILIGIYIMIRVNKMRYRFNNIQIPPKLFYFLYLFILLTAIQFLLGTNVRQQIDVIAEKIGFDNRTTWIDNLNVIFYLHRSFTIIVLITAAYLIKHLWLLKNKVINIWALSLIVVLFIEIIAGVVLAYFEMPKFMQPVHMLTAAVLLGIEFVILFILNTNKSNNVIQ